MKEFKVFVTLKEQTYRTLVSIDEDGVYDNETYEDTWYGMTKQEKHAFLVGEALKNLGIEIDYIEVE